MSGHASAPVLCRYEGDGEFHAIGRSRLACDKDFVVGEIYTLAEIHERTAKSHRHYFAALREAWQNLPEPLARRFATPEHLRRHALIKTGYFDSHSIACQSQIEAHRIAAFLRPVDEFAVIVVKHATITRFTAKSQSYGAMNKTEFQTSKDAVLDHVAAMIGVSRQELDENAGRAA